MVSSTVLIPLTQLDNLNPVGLLQITPCFVIDCQGNQFDVTFLESTFTRVLTKWRILAGRISKEKIDDIWQIKVPVGPLDIDYALFSSTVTTFSGNLDNSFFSQGPDDSRLMRDRELPMHHFRDEGVRANIAEMAESQIPLLGLKVALYDNAVLVGISVNHGIMDGTGVGIFFNALSKEMKGLNWDVPALQTKNLLQDQLMRLNLEPRQDIKNSQVQNFKSKIGLKNQVELPTSSMMYIGRNLIDVIIRAAKKETAALGDGSFVSTGDILMAWFAKICYPIADENELAILSTVQIRKTVAPASESKLLADYCHNAFIFATYPILNGSELNQLSVAALAQIFRKHRTEEHILEMISPPEIATQNRIKTSNRTPIHFSLQRFNSTSAISFNSCIRDDKKLINETTSVEEAVSHERTRYIWPRRIESSFSDYKAITEVSDSEGKGGNFSFAAVMIEGRWNLLEAEVSRLKAINSLNL